MAPEVHDKLQKLVLDGNCYVPSLPELHLIRKAVQPHKMPPNSVSRLYIQRSPTGDETINRPRDDHIIAGPLSFGESIWKSPCLRSLRSYHYQQGHLNDFPPSTAKVASNNSACPKLQSHEGTTEKGAACISLRDGQRTDSIAVSQCCAHAAPNCTNTIDH